MGKTRAEIQREYRERKKINDSTFLDKERRRQRHYRVPVAAQDESTLEAKRRKNVLYAKKYREKKKYSGIGVPSASSESKVHGRPTRNSQSARSSPLLVQFAFPKRNTNKKRSKALRDKQKQMIDITAKNTDLKKRVKRLQKRLQRLAKNSKGSSSTHLPAAMTPRTKTRSELRDAGLDQHALPQAVRKKLLFANVLTDQIRIKRKDSTKQEQRRILLDTISGKIVKKYRCIRVLHKKTGISRSTLSKVRRLRARKMTAVQKRVLSFLERDDVSRCMPGKRDATKKVQNRILTDYMRNTYEKFCCDNPDVKVSFSKFCKLRPSHVKLTSVLSRKTCLCTIHQNMAFKLKSIHDLGLDISPNPETAAKTVSDDQMTELLSQINVEEVEYESWQKVDVNGYKKMRIERVKKCRAEFIEQMRNDYASFLSHVERVRAQYKALADLKERLPLHDAIVQMDFAENFVCQSAEEIQSAYWNSTSVTLHPVVTYYKDAGGQLQHKSFVFVSDVGDHNAKTVVAILKKLVPLLREHIPNLANIHYWTDSPSSQYRNRFIFSTLCQHNDIFGVGASWDYFECGHGKSVCDGVGGTAKRQASDAVKQGKAVIQDATDFFAWASSHEKEITYVMYSNEDYDEASKMLASMDCQPIPGTMKIHSALPVNQTLLVKHTSCYCDNCLKGENRCAGWMVRTLKRKTPKSPEVLDEVEDNEPTAGGNHVVDDIPAVDEYVAALYADKWYVGKVLKVDRDDRDAEVTFMARTSHKSQSTTFKWPHQADIIWIPFDDILTVVSQPTPVGKSERTFQITAEQLFLIEELASAAEKRTH